MTGPRVDVVIPTRNRYRQTLEAIESVQGQTFPSWRVIVVDDGSSDGSGPALRAALAGDGRIVTVERREAGGAQVARQEALRVSDAPLVALLDSDDLWHAQKLSRQVDRHVERFGPDASGAVLCWHRWAGTGPARSASRRPQVDGLATPLVSNNMSTVLVAREALDRAGGFLPEGQRSLRTCDNIEFYVRLTASCDFTVVEEELVVCRSHSGPRASDGLGTTEAAEELASVLQLHAERLAAFPADRARLMAAVAARHLGAGQVLTGWSTLARAIAAAPSSTKRELALRYGPLVLRSLIRRPGRGPDEARGAKRPPSDRDSPPATAT
ncbi:MAG: glycosyltransferase family 2 protein [Anaerolineales bacterium]